MEVKTLNQQINSKKRSYTSFENSHESGKSRAGSRSSRQSKKLKRNQSNQSDSIDYSKLVIDLTESKEASQIIINDDKSQSVSSVKSSKFQIQNDLFKTPSKEIEVAIENEMEEDLLQMSPVDLKALFSDKKQQFDISDSAQKRNQYEQSKFENQCFKVQKIIKSKGFMSLVILNLAPLMDQYGTPQTKGFIECHLEFKLTVLGKWSQQLWAEVGDLVRVIGKFCPENQYSLTLDDDEDQSITKASMLIVEPYILIPCTYIVKAFPCPRNAFLSNQFKGMGGDINYALVLGNVIHAVFQGILQTMDFTQDKIKSIIQEAIKDQLVHLYYLKKTEIQVENDVQKGVRNITNWLMKVFKGDRNPHGIRFDKFIAAEQEFNTSTYGIKGNIDCTIVIEDKQGQKFQTALEIKTGKHKQAGYRGQVLLYSLLISERFLKSNPENILLYIMDENLMDGFQYIKQIKMELDSLIIGRNQLAKIQKFNNIDPKLEKDLFLKSQQGFESNSVFEDFDKMEIVKYPPMITRTQECKGCFANKICSISALSVEEHIKRKAGAGQFPVFSEIQQLLTRETKEYFKRFVECISLEQNAESDRNSSLSKSQGSNKDTRLKIVCIESNQQGGTIVTLERPLQQIKSNELPELAFVNLYTTNNITFAKGLILTKEIDFKPIDGQEESKVELPQGDEESIINEIESRMKNLEKYYNQYIIYTIEFQHLMTNNLSKLALGERDPFELDWTIEVEPFSTFSYSIMRSNIQAICIDERYLKAKTSIIDLKKQKKPLQDEINFLQQTYSEETKNLDQDQKNAIYKSVLCKNYHLVFGSSGTGKTTAIIQMIKILASMKKKVLLINFTNQTIDNLLCRLKESGFNQFIRITNNVSSVDPQIREQVVTPSKFESMPQIQETLDGCHVFAATCLQITNTLLFCLKFDFCIMDDASQISEPLAIGPILIASKFVMFGDHKLVNPQVKSFLAERKGMGISLFERLYNAFPDQVSQLKSQYRMNKNIYSLTKSVIYQSQDVSSSKAHPLSMSWLDSLVNNPVSFLDINPLISRLDQKDLQKLRTKNFIELDVIKLVIQNIVQEMSLNPNKISLITPFHDQCSFLTKELIDFGLKTITTIDKCQYLENDVIIISCGKQTNDKVLGVRELKKIGIALARCRQKLIIVGAESKISDIPVIKKIINHIKEKENYQVIEELESQIQSSLPTASKPLKNKIDS